MACPTTTQNACGLIGETPPKRLRASDRELPPGTDETGFSKGITMENHDHDYLIEENCQCGIDASGNWSEEIFEEFGCTCRDELT